MHDKKINPSFNGLWSIYFIDTWSMKGIVETDSIFGGPCKWPCCFCTNAKNWVPFKKQQLTTRIMIFVCSGSLLTFASYHYCEGVLASHLNQASWWILCVLRFANQFYSITACWSFTVVRIEKLSCSTLVSGTFI